ncbi:cell division cycle- protein [Malassezia sp. CBS 17886]|nr:cell division cycle- protein [Malassezia sp. CBS 17886]
MTRPGSTSVSTGEACCTIPPARTDGAPQGTYVELAQMCCYVAGDLGGQRAVIGMYDVFGMWPSTLQGADILAAHMRTPVVIPDVFRGHALSTELLPFDTPEKRGAYAAFATEHANPQARVRDYVRIAAALRAQGHVDLVAYGLCWGAKCAVLAGQPGTSLRAIAQVHPSLLDPALARTLAVPVASYTSRDEDVAVVAAFDRAVRENPAVAAQSEFFVYADECHGFAGARADLRVSARRAAFQDVYARLAAYFASVAPDIAFGMPVASPGAEPAQERAPDRATGLHVYSSFFVRALYAYTATDTNLLSFPQGAVLEILGQLESGWWDALRDEHSRGWIPSNYVELITDEEAAQLLGAPGGAPGAHALDRPPAAAPYVAPLHASATHPEARSPALNGWPDAHACAPVPELIDAAGREITYLIFLTSQGAGPDDESVGDTQLALVDKFVQSTTRIVHTVRRMLADSGLSELIRTSHGIDDPSERQALLQLQTIAKETTALLSLLVLLMRGLTKKLHEGATLGCAPADLRAAYLSEQRIMNARAYRLVDMIHVFGRVLHTAPPGLQALLRVRSAPPAHAPTAPRSAPVVAAPLPRLGLSADALAVLNSGLVAPPHGVRRPLTTALLAGDVRAAYAALHRALDALFAELRYPHAGQQDGAWEPRVRDVLEQTCAVAALLESIDVPAIASRIPHAADEHRVRQGHQQLASTKQRLVAAAAQLHVAAQGAMDASMRTVLDASDDHDAAVQALWSRASMLELDARHVLLALQQCPRVGDARTRADAAPADAREQDARKRAENGACALPWAPALADNAGTGARLGDAHASVPGHWGDASGASSAAHLSDMSAASSIETPATGSMLLRHSHAPRLSPTSLQFLARAVPSDARPPELMRISTDERVPMVGQTLAPLLGSDVADGDIVYAQNGSVKGGTLQALVTHLTQHDTYDSKYNQTFLTTYRSFTTTAAFLALVMQRYRLPEPLGLSPMQRQDWTAQKQLPIRLRAINAIKTWLESYYLPSDAPCLDDVERFVRTDLMGGHAGAKQEQLLRLIQRRRGGGHCRPRVVSISGTTPVPLLPVNMRNARLTDLDPLEVARQLTLMESRLFTTIKPTECLGKAWSSADAATLAPGILNTIAFHNRMTGWITESILAHDSIARRARELHHFVHIGHQCRGLNNFASVWSIVSALNSTSIFRLRRTWDLLSGRTLELFRQLERITDTSKNYAGYRELLCKISPPCVPFLGLYTKDLTFIEDGNPDMLYADPRLINFSKRQRAADIIAEITTYQSTPYNLTPVPAMIEFLEARLEVHLNEHQHYHRSLVLEPRQSAVSADERLSQLLQENGFI